MVEYGIFKVNVAPAQRQILWKLIIDYSFSEKFVIVSLNKNLLKAKQTGLMD